MNVKKRSSRLRAWGLLVFGFFCVWLFAFVVGPWLQNKIPTFQQIIQVIEERDIDSGAYFYTGIDASYDGAQYILESLKLSVPNEVGLTLPFIFAIVLCGVILWLGYRYLPSD